MKAKVTWWLAAIWLMGLAAYSNSLSGPFVFDALVEITGNQALQTFDMAALWQRYPTRIVTYVTLAVNYAIGGLNTSGYHIVNLAIHLLAATVIFFLARELAGGTQQKKHSDLLGGVAALLFVSHPIQTQAVTYIIQRLASLTALLYFLGLLLYVLARKHDRYRQWLHPAAWLTLFLAMFSKEIAFTAPLAVVMIELFFFQKSAAVKGVMRLRRLAPTLPYLLLLLVIPTTLFVSRPALLEPGQSIETAVTPVERPLTAETSSLTRAEYFLTEINVVRTYVRLLVWPVKQNLDYDYPLSHSLFEARTVGSLAFLIALAGLGGWLYRRNRLASFGIWFFFLTLAVESSVIPIRDVIFEHRVYLPSFGIFLALAAGAAWVWQRSKQRVILTGVFTILIVTLASMTFARNGVWADEVTLWQDVTEKSPRKARGYNNIGAVLVQRGEEEVAQQYFEQALAVDGRSAEAYNNLGLLKTRQGLLAEAVTLFERAIVLEPQYAHALNNLGVVYLQQEQVDAAVAALQQAVQLIPSFTDAWVNLGAAYLEQGDFFSAQHAFEQALKLAPVNEKARLGQEEVQRRLRY